jgi:hypothetical protein
VQQGNKSYDTINQVRENREKKAKKKRKQRNGKNQLQLKMAHPTNYQNIIMAR